MAGPVGALSWDDLVLPKRELKTLAAIVDQVRCSANGRAGDGKAPNAALFAGPDRTGKSLAAALVARKLGRDLHRIDLGAAVSKYIGETEKNMRRAFADAEGSGAVLLFDDAEALFGTRGDVKDSHDRHANIEADLLLRRIETFDGLVILTANRKENIDQAFLRRLRFVVQFAGPPAAIDAAPAPRPQPRKKRGALGQP